MAGQGIQGELRSMAGQGSREPRSVDGQGIQGPPRRGWSGDPWASRNVDGHGSRGLSGTWLVRGSW